MVEKNIVLQEIQNRLENPLVSFILPNYNNEYILDLMFERFLANNTYENYEFIVVDDGSMDNGVELLKKWKNSGKIKNMTVLAKKHRGIIPALNDALAHVRGDFIIRLDGDATIETPGFVEKLLEIYNINPEKIGVITGLTMVDSGRIFTTGRNVVQDIGICSTHAYPTEPIGKRMWDDRVAPRDDAEYIAKQVAEVDTVLGCFAFCDTATARKIGGFDKSYPLWIEDDDFYFSFRLYGKKCFYVPDILICHRLSLRGNRNPAAWNKKHRLFWKDTIGHRTRYHFLNMVLFQTSVKGGQKRYFIGNGKIKVFQKRVSELSWREQILQHDYDHWEQKWGFSLLNPDLDKIAKKYKNTEIMWRYTPALKQIGENIIEEIKKLEKKWNS